VQQMASKERRRPRLKDLPGGQITELIVIVAMALAIALLVQWLLIKPYRIPSGSMEPTLDVGQRVLVNRLTHRLGADPSIGDIITFHPPAGADVQPAQCGAPQAENQSCTTPTRDKSDQTFIKRVVGVGGDRISIVNGHVIRNGVRERDSYIRPCGATEQCNFPTTITVPAGSYYVMGDNRGNSDDGRFWGPVPKKWIIGRAFATYWPPDRIGTL
jgi:signal peptidase I